MRNNLAMKVQLKSCFAEHGHSLAELIMSAIAPGFWGSDGILRAPTVCPPARGCGFREFSHFSAFP